VNGPSGKYLLDWVNGFSHQSLFFLFWAVLISVFVGLMLRTWTKHGERQFRKNLPKKGALVVKPNEEKSIVKNSKP
jgi:hypothetical protein